MKIDFQRHTLSNGLKVIIHQDKTTPLVSSNLIYKVGSRNESDSQTGLAHLFEHFMFCGSKNIPNFDYYLQKAGAINNAYTSQDITHYYEILPASNLETALWLESDRMKELAFDEKSLQIQKHVVIEEFKENYLNRPFGDLMINIHKVLYKKHPYKWLPIGKKIEHIEKIDMNMMKFFFYKYYRPNNAILTISGNIDIDNAVDLVHKWFDDIPSGTEINDVFVDEPVQKKTRTKIYKGDYPHNIIVMGWLICDRNSPDYCGYDLISDLFGHDNSSYLYKKFVIEKPLFSQISCSISSKIDKNYFLISAVPNENVDSQYALRCLADFLNNFDYNTININHDLQKVKNNVESAFLMNEIKLEDRSSMLAVMESYSSIEKYEEEKDMYASISFSQIEHLSKALFVENRACCLIYEKKQG